jgi:alcohol dehydrogenase, propanol-preferring
VPIPAGGGGLGLDGGIPEFMLIPAARQLVPLPDGLDGRRRAADRRQADAYYAIRGSWPKLAPGSTAVVIGAGGLRKWARGELNRLTRDPAAQHIQALRRSAP